jgi:cytochrome P450
MMQAINQQIHETPGYTHGATSVVEINHWATKVTIDIIGLAALGRDFQSLKNEDDLLIQTYEELLNPTRAKQIHFAGQIFGPAKFIRSLPWKLNERNRVIVQTLNDVCMKLVRDKKQWIKSGGDEHKDILSLCIRSGNFSDEQLVDQLLTFIAAGHETTSSALTWTCYLLAKHPEIQSALREEVHRLIPSPSTTSRPDQDLASTFESAPLLNGVCNESIRLYPTVPVTVRTNPRETVLLGRRIPAHTQILLSPWAINRNPESWGPDADAFTPYRWIDTDPQTGEQRPNNSGGAPSNYDILTFLHGPRSCIGQGFAKAELRCLTAAIVGSFEMTLARPEEKVVPHGVVTTKPKDGMHLRLKPLGAW